MAVLKKAKKMHATARTRPCFLTTDPKEDYKECGEPHMEYIDACNCQNKTMFFTTDPKEDHKECGEPLMECIDAVKQIWQSNDGGHLIGRVGPYNITDDSSPTCILMEHELPRNQDSPTCI